MKKSHISRRGKNEMREEEFPEWTQYNGSDEQIEELMNAVIHGDGFITEEHSCVYNKQVIPGLPALQKLFTTADRYFIVNRHKCSSMIARQAQTGQPVWIYLPGPKPYLWQCTVNPDWNLPGMIYSFSPLKDAKS
jgi:hypothetical protein